MSRGRRVCACVCVLGVGISEGQVVESEPKGTKRRRMRGGREDGVKKKTARRDGVITRTN